MSETSAPPYDAFLLLSFGGPEGPDDVMPFLRNVTAGRGIPPQRLEQVAAHYYQFGGVSPINQQCRDLLAAVEKDFAVRGIGLPVYWGNRNWQPYLADTLRDMAAAGVRCALALATSAYSSFSGCRQYLGDIELARAAAGAGAPLVDKIRPYFDHPGFIDPLASAAAAAAGRLPVTRAAGGTGPGEQPAAPGGYFDLVCTAHSIPEAMSAASGPAGNAYPAQLAEVAGLVAERVSGVRSVRLAYSSRSGPPSAPWLEPDISDCLAELAGAGSPGVVVLPIGFVSDHMEVKFDLDVEAAQTAERLGLPMARAATPGTDPRFVAMVSELVAERTSAAPRRALGSRPPLPEPCLTGCCAPALGPAGASG